MQSTVTVAEGPFGKGLFRTSNPRLAVGTPVPRTLAPGFHRDRPPGTDGTVAGGGGASPGDVLLRVPLGACASVNVPGVSPEARAAPELAPLLSSGCAWEVKLGAVVLWSARAPGSPARVRDLWGRYLGQMPGPGEVTTGVALSEAELPLLRDPVLAARCRAWRGEVDAAFRAHLAGREAESGVAGPAELRWATALVESRAFEAPRGTGGAGRAQLLVPFLDLANHGGAGAVNASQRLLAPVAASELPGLEGEALELAVLDSFMELVAERPVPDGGEVLISYGDKPARLMLEQYGFCLPGSPRDRVAVPDCAVSSGLPGGTVRVGGTAVLSRAALSAALADGGGVAARLRGWLAGVGEAGEVAGGRVASVRGSLVDQFGWKGSVGEYLALRRAGGVPPPATLLRGLSDWAWAECVGGAGPPAESPEALGEQLAAAVEGAREAARAAAARSRAAAAAASYGAERVLTLATYSLACRLLESDGEAADAAAGVAGDDSTP